MLRLGGNSSPAENLAHETIIDAVRSAHAFRGETSRCTWLFAIARRKLAKHFERERRIEPISDPVIESTYSDHEERLATRDQVVRAMGAIAPTYRQILVMKYLDEMSAHQIAA